MKCDRCERDATVFPPLGYGWPGSFCADCFSPVVGVFVPAPPPTPEPRLRPCPLCGSPADRSGHWACVMCSDIDCSFVGPDPDPDGERWNEVAVRLKRDRVAEAIRFLVARHRAERDHLRERLIDEQQRRRRVEDERSRG